jgi:Cd2+/Zn2+-exporting ATPase
MHLLFSPYLSLVLATVLLNGVKAIFKLKFSSINLLTIAVVAAFIWENTQQL